jgi:hypothetical protein
MISLQGIKNKTKRNKMAEEKDAHDLAESVLSRDDMSALAYVLQHVKGSSPSSVTRLGLEMSELDDAA